MLINDEEIWKSIKDFPNYEVSNLGRVRNKNTNNILKPALDKTTGYLKVNLWNNGTEKMHTIHRLVANAFIPNPEMKRVVNHLDCIKTNNRVENLVWATDSENMKHAFDNGLCENTRKAAYVQQEILSKKPRTQKQRDTARQNIITINKRPKTERQLKTSKRNLSSNKCKEGAKLQKYNKHPPIRVIETGEIYRSQRDLAERLDVSESAICACLHGRREHAGSFHFEYVCNEQYEVDNVIEPLVKPFLYDFQLDAVNRMRNGCILCGSVGSGKSRTGLFYYFKENGGWIEGDEYTPMKRSPQDLIIITTPQKRDNFEWSSELSVYRLSNYPDLNILYDNRVIIDSWNRIKEYVNEKNCFFIFDEDRLTGNGAWVKSFLKIAKNNNWIILSATPADTWIDFIPVFIANGYYRNRTEFNKEHVRFSQYTKYPMVEGYFNEEKLKLIRDDILVDMDFTRNTIQHHEDIYCRYSVSKYREIIRNRWDPFKNEPIGQASGLCYTLRRLVNSDESRQVALLELIEKNPKAIIFYSFDYELEILKSIAYPEGTTVAEYNGHTHDPLPDGGKWVYLVNYASGNAGWNCITTNCIIFFSQSYSYKIMTQAAGRIDRLNTPYTDLYYYHLKTRSGIDLAISKALREKKKFNERKFTKWDK